MTLVSGDQQTATVGKTLAQPFVVALADGAAAPVAGVAVVFSVTGGSGSLSATTATTDAAGRARSTLTLGPTPGANTVAAIATGYTGSPVVFTATGIAAPTSNVWTLQVAQGAPGSPATRFHHAMAWDGTGALLFGGLSPSAGADLNDLWSYDPATKTWTNLLANGAAGSPSARDAASFAPTPRGVILFGGGQGGSPGGNGTWSFDRATNKWTQVSVDGDPANPPARYDAATAWDGAEVLVFGGRVVSEANDLWAYDPGRGTWTRRLADGLASSPPQRFGASAVWDGQHVILFGGTTSAARFNDTWSYDPSTNTWTRRIANGDAASPPARYDASMVWDGTEVLLFGGRDVNTNALGDLWRYDPATNGWTLLVASGSTGAPSSRTAAGVAWTGGRLLLFGGFDATFSFVNDLWSYTPTTSPPAPTVRAVTPDEASVGAATGVTVEGAGFQTGASVTVGSLAATGVTVISEGRITATFPDDVAGVRTVTVTNPDGTQGALGGGFARTAGAPPAAVALVFDAPPTATWVNAVLRPVVRVSLRDGSGRIVPSSLPITVQITTNPGGATLAGTTTVANVNGVASFTDLALDKTGAGYVLTATQGGLSIASAPFTVASPPASTFAISRGPTNVVSLAAISPSVQVTIFDGSGAVETNAIANVSVALGANPGGATLGGTTTVAAVNGVATFADLSLDKVGTGYTLVFSINGLSGPTSGGFDVAPGAPRTFQIIQDPTSVVAGAAISPAVVVRLFDAAGNVATTPQTVTVALATNPGGGTLGGTKTVTSANGDATFATLTVDRAAAGYQLGFTSAGVTAATSSAFDVSPGAPATMVLVAAPTRGGAGVFLAPAPQVRLQDALGNVCVQATSSVHLALGSNPVGAHLKGIVDVAAASGVATFPQAYIDTAGTGFTLVFSSSGLSDVTTGSFNVTDNPPVVVSLSVPPGSLSGVVPITYAVQQDDGVRVDMLVEFAASGAGPFQRATEAPSALGAADGIYGVLSSAAAGGAPHTFLWDSHADWPSGTTTTAQLRVTATFHKTAGTTRTLSNLTVTNSAATRVGVDLIAPRVASAQYRAQNVRIADMNGDGKKDVVSAAYGGLVVLYGDGAARVDTTTTTSIGGTTIADFAIADLDGDGNNDIVACNGSGAAIAYGTGSTSFTGDPGVSAGNNVIALAVGDLDEDGLPDVLLSSEDGTASVLSLSVFVNAGSRTFRALPSTAVTSAALAMKLVDVNGDGHLDLVALYQSGSWGVSFGAGDGTFGATTFYSASAGGSISVADLDADGHPDVVVADGFQNIYVYLNQGAGTFGAATTYTVTPTPANTLFADVGDVNGDGVPDIVSVTYNGEQVVLLLGTGGGAFAPPQYLRGGRQPSAVALGDLSGSGRNDMAVVFFYEREMSIYRDTSSGFGTMQALTCGPAPRGLVAVDLDKNGTLDLVSADSGGGSATVFLGAAKSFGAGVSYTTNSQAPISIATGDFDGDTKQDVVVANALTNELWVLLGDEAGGLAAPITTTVGTGLLRACVAADLDGDGKTDVAVADDSSGGVYILRSIGGGAFAAPDFIATGTATGLLLQDVDGDGKIDLVCTSGNSLVIAKGAGGGTFAAPTALDLGQPLGALVIADLDGDTKLDVAVVAGTQVLVLHGQGGGSFAAPAAIETGASMGALAAGDVNGDGRIDLVFVLTLEAQTSLERSLIGVLENRGGGTFAWPVYFHPAHSANALVVADFDGDGIADVGLAGQEVPVSTPLRPNLMVPMFGR